MKKKKNLNSIVRSLAPIAGFVAVTIFFAIATKGDSLSTSNLQSLTNQIIVVALVSIGSVFVFGTGNLDMSLGGCVCISAVLSCMAVINTGSLIVGFLVCMGVSLAIGFLKGVFCAYVEVPTFIVTIVLGMIITSVVLVIMGKESTYYVKNAVTEVPSPTFTQMTVVNVVTLGIYFLGCVVIFNYTGIGRKIKAIGGNLLAARQTGINIRRTEIIAFLIGAVGIGLASFILLVRTRTVGSTTGSTLGTDVMVALVLGGMPITGGPRSKISAGIIGAATITVLNNGLTMMGLPTDIIQTSRGIIFLVVVFITSYSYRTKLLPR